MFRKLKPRQMARFLLSFIGDEMYSKIERKLMYSYLSAVRECFAHIPKKWQF